MMSGLPYNPGSVLAAGTEGRILVETVEMAVRGAALYLAIRRRKGTVRDLAVFDQLGWRVRFLHPCSSGAVW